MIRRHLPAEIIRGIYKSFNCFIVSYFYASLIIVVNVVTGTATIGMRG